ncbi:hypothetical protein FPOAC1_007344 [Fusarium poae]|uniref:hypothetical protein n=1 Tax=Fusarium poae TaxID=36050 RepID=UPI001CE842BC|nr:hypothetical protein FPOAC1_007344 [Fusarium poae]KAG8674025.1 hypothetical protein FPOAC1_007344 [Fusarium poae]
MESDDIMLPSLPPSAFFFSPTTKEFGESIRADDASQHCQTTLQLQIFREHPLSPYWACRLCDAKGQPEFFAAAATSSAADHLRKPQTDRPAILVRPTDQSCRSDWVV